MLQLNEITKAFGLQNLFHNATLVINSGERVGLVGRNGTGKSTLFKIILGEESVDDGTVVIPRGYRVGHLAQYLKFTEDDIVSEACLGLPSEERDQRYRAEIILHGLGFSMEDLGRSPNDFSGGFQIRLNLAKLILSDPDLLLLDEPTNYLDIVSSRWLQRFLTGWKKELLLITHDRSFMDSVTTHTAVIYRKGIKKILGDSKKLYEQIAADEAVYENTRLNEEKRRKEIEQFITRFRAQASKAALVQSRVKMLEKMGEKDSLTDEPVLDFDFSFRDTHAKVLLEATDITFGYDPAHPLYSHLSCVVRNEDRIGIIGKNGRGKSTLLKSLAGELVPQSGAIKPHSVTQVGYFGQTNIDRLNQRLTVEQEIESAHPQLHRTAVRAICGAVMFSGDSALKPVSVLSGGEKSRVLLGKIIARPTNMLLLDEPTNHLDIESTEALKQALKRYGGAAVIVTHQEDLLRELCNRLIVFQGDAPFIFEGSYDQFLKEVGWEDEWAEGAPSSTKGAVGSNGSRGKGSQGNSDSDGSDEDNNGKKSGKAVHQIKKQITRTEEQIFALEESLVATQHKLTDASLANDNDEMCRLVDKMGTIQSEIDRLFGVLENLESQVSGPASES